MLPLATDENVDEVIVSRLRADPRPVDVVRVVDTNRRGATDPEVLEWAARGGRILVTKDVQTMIGFARDRVERGLPMPGLVVIRKRAAVARVVEAIRLIAECYPVDEMAGQVVFVPL